MDPVFVLAAPKSERDRAATPDEIDAFYDQNGLEGLRAVLVTPRRIWTMTTRVFGRNGRWRRLLGPVTEAKFST